MHGCWVANQVNSQTPNEMLSDVWNEGVSFTISNGPCWFFRV